MEGVSVSRSKSEKSLSIPSIVRMAKLLFLHKIPSFENVLTILWGEVSGNGEEKKHANYYCKIL